jgi:hypothetical protein
VSSATVDLVEMKGVVIRRSACEAEAILRMLLVGNLMQFARLKPQIDIMFSFEFRLYFF